MSGILLSRISRPHYNPEMMKEVAYFVRSDSLDFESSQKIRMELL